MYVVKGFLVFKKKRGAVVYSYYFPALPILLSNQKKKKKWGYLPYDRNKSADVQNAQIFIVWMDPATSKPMVFTPREQRIIKEKHSNCYYTREMYVQNKTYLNIHFFFFETKKKHVCMYIYMYFFYLLSYTSTNTIGAEITFFGSQCQYFKKSSKQCKKKRFEIEF